MAEIPVQRKSNMSWLWWLLALVVIGLVVWWIIASTDDGPGVYVNTGEMQAVPPVGETVVEPPVDTAAAGSSLAGLNVGNEVDLDGLNVTSVTGDMSFMVADSQGRQAMVVFDQTPTPNTPTEGRLDINNGMTVNLHGRVMDARQPLPAGVNASFPDCTAMYIMADTIDVTQRSATPGTTTAEGGATSNSAMNGMNAAATNAAR